MAVFDEVREILVEQLAVKPEMVKAESKLIEDLGGDSLDAVEIVTALEERFGIEIPDDEATKVITVNDILELVSQKLQAKPAKPS